MTTISETLWQIICGAECEGLAAVQAVQDYFAEKDSRITLAEARVLVAEVKTKYQSMEVSL